MKILVLAWALMPLLLTGGVIITGSTTEGALALLLLMILNKTTIEDAISSIEHKIDSVSKAVLSNADEITNYNLLHKTNWDHDYPINVDKEMQKYGKIRMNQLSTAKLVISIGIFCLFLVLLSKITFWQ